MLQQVFGSTSFAISTLLTAFMAGLALGSWLGGKYAHKFGDQLRVYGLLEGSVGAYALAVPFVLDLLPSLYGLLFEHFIEDFLLFSLLRFVAVFAILLIPTTLMGATLPLVSQWVADRQKLFQGSIGFLYGVNTFGACAGCFLAGFVLIPALGLSTTNTLFASASLTLGVIIVLSSSRLRDSGDDTDPELDEVVSELGEEAAAIVDATPRAAPHPKWALYAALVAFGLTGLIAMAYQVLWTRAYLITLGSSTYSFTLVLTAVLIGIALGSAAMSPFLKRIARPLFWFSIVQFGVATTAALSFFTLDRVPMWLYQAIQEATAGPTQVYAMQFLLVALVVFLPSFLQGMSFPLVIRAVTDRAEQSGADVGNAYAFNTTGAIIGSFVAGFVLMPWLGLQGAITAVVGLNLIVAVGLAGVELRLHRRLAALVALAVAAVASIGLFVAAPALDRAQLTIGAFRAGMVEDLIGSGGFDDYDPEILYYEDGLTATTSVERQGGLVTLRANGKPEASDGVDMPTQILVGIMPLAIRSGFDDVEPGDESVAMIGYGSGVTAGAALQWPLKRLDVVEIEATMIEASRYFDHVNHQPLDDGRTNIVESDGRNYLEYTPRTFDVIISEPSNPWIAGVSSLFTVEFFERARHKLEPNGVFGQWVQLYEMHPDNVRTIFETFRSVFPHVQAFSTQSKSAEVLLVGSEQPLPFPPDGYDAAWQIDSVADEFARAGVADPWELYGLKFMNQQQIEEFGAGAELNTDDNGLLEFSTPRDVLFPDAGRDFFVDWYFGVDDYGDPRPYLDDWPHGWSDDEVARLARGIWVSGKPKLTRNILDDAGVSLHRTDSSRLEDVYAVLDASQQARADVVADHWPNRDSELHERAQQLFDSPALRQHDLEHLADDPPTDGETGLYYALLLTEDRQFQAAERHFERLDELGELADEPAYQFLRAGVLEVRRRYAEAYDGFLQFGKN